MLEEIFIEKNYKKENKLKNRKECKLDRYKNLRWSEVALLQDKNVDYSPDVIAN